MATWTAHREAIARLKAGLPLDPPRITRAGPGTELVRLIAQVDRLLAPFAALLAPLAPHWAAALDLSEQEGCQCLTRARQMDLWGCDECARRLDEIAGWLIAAAKERDLDVHPRIARWCVRRAIAAARHASDRSPSCR
jgi:hypothetical protein